MTLYDESGQVVDRQRRAVVRDALPGGRFLSADDGAWRARAACLGMDASTFYPHPVQPKSSLYRYDTLLRQEREAQAKRICAGCGVREECLAFAQRTGQEDGIWGGLNPKERRGRSRSGKRKCSECDVVKPLDEFSWSGSSYRSRCKACQFDVIGRDANRRWRERTRAGQSALDLDAPVRMKQA